MNDAIRECSFCDSAVPLERVGLRFVCPCCARAADDELPAGASPVEPAAECGRSEPLGGEFLTATGRQAHEATETAPGGPGRENAGAPDAEPAPGVAAVLAALRADDRDPRTGRFRLGHFRNLKGGHRTPRLFEAGPLREVLVERETGVLADLGGEANVSRVERPLVREYARLDVLVEAAGERLIQGGLETSKGRARAAASLYLSLLDKQVRVAGMLGLQRRARPAASITDWAARVASEPKS